MRNRKVLFIISALFLLIAVSGCNYKKLKEIRATSWSLESVSLRGLRSLQANLALELDNPSMKVTLKDIKGVIYYEGEPFVNYTMDPITLAAKSAQVYQCTCLLELDPSKSILDVLATLPNLSTEKMTTDISAKAKVKGISKSFAFKNVPVKRFMKK